MNRNVTVNDPRRRVTLCLAVFGFLLVLVFARAVQLEWSEGADYRAEAVKPVEKRIVEPGKRGTLSARDGTILAYDKEMRSLAVHYRYLQDPPDANWLNATVRSRLPKSDRKNVARLAEEQRLWQKERDTMFHRLAQACGLSDEEWTARAKRIQHRIETMIAQVNDRRQRRAEEANESSGNDWSDSLRQRFKNQQSTERWVLAEERDYHVMFDDPAPALIEEIERNGKQYPGVKIVSQLKRFYPLGKSAGNVLGYCGQSNQRIDAHENSLRFTKPPTILDENRTGLTGVEKSYEEVLRGRPGIRRELVDRSGRLLESTCLQKVRNGSDLTLTLDLKLQQTAEELLDRADSQRRSKHPKIVSAGGAVVVMDIADGSLRALATSPRYDPNQFVDEFASERTNLLSNPARPLFDRSFRMTIAPGSVFKIVTAAALLESENFDPEKPYFCRGYLNRPEKQRCEIFVKQGVGHGETTLDDALCVSCNTYFFHHAERLGSTPLVAWAERFGFGRRTGVDLPGEAEGVVPNPENIVRLEKHSWTKSDTQALAIGQGSLTVTPLQTARLLARIAGQPVEVDPHVVSFSNSTPSEKTTAAEINRKLPRPSEKNLAILRKGLERVVTDPAGTAHELFMEDLSVAGKTGTAETSSGPSHAWFAGYVPADKPRYVLVVALQHTGDASTTAVPIAKRLIGQMKQNGYFSE